MSWRRKRQALILTILSLIILGFSFYKLYPYIVPAPSCFDNKLNGDETGIDCGGSCEKICQVDIIPLAIKYTRFVESEYGLYDFIAMVENKNGDKVPENSKMLYSFTAYDKAGKIIKVIEGEADVPVGQNFPVIEQNIPLDFGSSGNALDKISFNILNNYDSWQKADTGYKENFFEIKNYTLEPYKNGITQLEIVLENRSPAIFRNVPIKVLLLDGQGNIYAANETLKTEIKSREIFPVIFTWRNPLKSIDPTIEVYGLITPNTFFLSD